MTSGRRLAVLLVGLALVGAPAVVLRVLCAGESCTERARASVRVPFCPLPPGLRALMVSGFRDGRSPDVMAATQNADVASLVPGGSVAWPAIDRADPRVPIVFGGSGVRAGPLPAETGLDMIAPTLEAIAGFRRPHPEVRSGAGIPGVADRTGTRLIVLIGWKGVGTAELEAAPDAWPRLRSLVAGGAGTVTGTTGSLPLDPAATLTTIGTGAIPAEHGIIGSLIRDDRGRVVRAWSDAAPPSIVSTFAEDLDDGTGQTARVGLVAPRATDRGLVGGDWYLDADRDDRRMGPGDPVRAVSRLIATGYGRDPTVDVLGVVLEGSLARMDRTSGAIVRLIRGGGVPATFVVAGTGSGASTATVAAATVATDVETALGAPVVAHEAAGGLFLDREALIESGFTTDDVSRTLRGIPAAGGGRLFADAFPAFAVSFSRYC